MLRCHVNETYTHIEYPANNSISYAHDTFDIRTIKLKDEKKEE